MMFSFVEVDITPIKSTPLAGFAKRSSNDLKFGSERLFLRVIRLCSKDKTLYFITVDTLYIPSQLADFIVTNLRSIYNVESSDIIFNASHTHSAPNIIGGVFGPLDSHYLEYVKKKIISELPKLKLEKSCTCSIAVSDLPIGLIVNRRKRLNFFWSRVLKRKIVMQPNFKKSISVPLYVFRINTNQGEQHIIYSMSCHPVFANTRYTSADYPGIVNELVKKSGYTSCSFMQGFCGDLKASTLVSKNIRLAGIKDFFKKMLFGEAFKVCEPNDMYKFSKRIHRQIIENIELSENLLPDTVDTVLFETSLQSICGKVDKCFKVKIISINKTIVLISIPAEVSFSFYEHLIEEFPKVNIVPLGYSEGMIGYIPDEYDFELGGYEVNCFRNYSWPSPLCPESIAKFKVGLISEISKVV